MKKDLRPVVLLRLLFFCLIAGCLVLSTLLYKNFNINTSLSDVTPSLQHSIDIQQALGKLQSNLQSRVLLMISSDDEDQLDEAEDYLRDELSQIKELHLFPNEEEAIESLILALTPYRFSFLTANHLEKINTLSPQAIADEGVRNLYSLNSNSVFGLHKDPLGWHSDALIGSFPSTPDQSSDQEKHRIVTATLSENALDLDAQERLSLQLKSIIEATQTHTHSKLLTSGVFFFAEQSARSAKKDIATISTISTIGVILLLLIAFKTFKALLLPLTSIALGMGFAVIVTHNIYGSLHILTIVFGTGLIGIAVDYALHYMVHTSSHGFSKTNSPLIKALSLSLATSLIGYSALGYSGLEALEKIAVFSCSGLFMAWLTVVCWGQYAINQNSSYRGFLKSIVAHLNNLLAKIPRALLTAIIVLIAAFGLWLFSNGKIYSDDPSLLFKPDRQLLENERRVASLTHDFEPGQFIVLTGSTQSQIYDLHNQFIAKIRENPNFKQSNFSSLMDWLPDVRALQNNLDASSKIYSLDGVASSLIQNLHDDSGFIHNLVQEFQLSKHKLLSAQHMNQLLEERGFPPMWFESNQNELVAFILIQKGVSAIELKELTKSLENVDYINSLQSTQQALINQRESAIKVLLFAIGVIALFLLFRHRGVTTFKIMLVPISAIFCIIIIFSVFNLSINLFSIMALFLVLGFGMDYVIFVSEMSNDQELALQAILLSALTSLLSFGLLGLSQIPVVSSFGMTLLVGNIINLIGTFVLSQYLTSQT